MAGLEALPNELLAQVAAFSNRKSLAQLRLTSKRLENIAVVKLFERVTLYAHWTRGPTRYVDGLISTNEYSEDESDQENAAERSGRAMEENEDDGFIVRSYPEKHDGDGLGAGSDTDVDDLSKNGDEDLDLRPRLLDETSVQEKPTEEVYLYAAEAINRSPRPGASNDELLDDIGEQLELRRQNWVSARPQWVLENYPGPPDYDAAMFLNIVENERLKKFVKNVHVYTCETHCDHHPKIGSDWYHDQWPEPDFHPRYTDSIQRIGEFPNLCGLTVHFDRHGAGDNDDVFQILYFQQEKLEEIMRAAQENIRHLAVRHYPNPQDAIESGYGVFNEKLYLSRFLRKVAAASSLRLSVTHAEMHPDAGVTYRDGHINYFWGIFPALHLHPASDTLTTLVLYSDIPLGWFPKLDLQGVHLRKLSSLTLGHHIIHHDRQVDWIISHQETLRELIFDRCSILYQIGCNIPDWLDDDGYPQKVDEWGEYGYSYDPDMEDPLAFETNLLLKSNNLRWDAIFSRFASSLPHLCEFRFGVSSQWDFNTTPFHFRAGAAAGMPIMPWEDEHNIKSSLFDEMYVIWDDWENEYRTKWSKTDRRGREVFGIGWRDAWLARLEKYPLRCKDADALQALIEITKSR